MKSLLRNIIIYTISLYLVILYIPGVKFSAGYEYLAAAGAGLALLVIFIRPLLKVLFLPINLLTLGVSSGFINIILLYLLNRFFEPLSFSEWHFPGFSYQGFTAPELDVGIFWTYVLTSFIIAALSNTLNWLCD